MTNEGDGNYFPVARSSWYPNNPNAGLGEYTSYDMTFHIPKGMKFLCPEPITQFQGHHFFPTHRRGATNNCSSHQIKESRFRPKKEK